MVYVGSCRIMLVMPKVMYFYLCVRDILHRDDEFLEFKIAA